jgi:Domain of unknown function (DUF1906)
MRRAISAALVAGLVLGGAAAMPAFAAERGHSVTPLKTVVYDGYQLTVPASWPVYRLTANSTTCVRYDIQAVYLGTPSANMNCLAGQVGRAQTVSVIPSTTVAAGVGSEVTYQREQPDGVGGTKLGTLGAVNGVVTQNATAHELRVVLGAAQPATVVATYDASPAVVEQVLASLRVVSRSSRATPQTMTPAASPSPASVSTSWKGLPARRPVQAVQSPPQRHLPAGPVLGFDTCTAPSLKTMGVWRQRYAAVGVYIGGVNYACAFGNLSASWIQAAASMGWGMLPTYVGPQAPCWGYQGVTISPKHAAADGRAAGADAVLDARLFGLPHGSPIYYDMEAYNTTHWRICVPAVLTFLGAWDRTVAAAGYVTGVYSSQDSGIVDMQRAVVDKTPDFTPPDAIWFALWDNIRALSDGILHWPFMKRNKQYSGNVNVTVGKIKLDIDRDLVSGPLAR